MKYEELKQFLQGEDIKKAISILTAKAREIDVETYKEQWDTETHDVCKEDMRPNKTVKVDDNEGNETTRMEYVNRVPIPLQKNIVGKAVTFLFGNPVEIKSETQDASEVKVLDALNRILDDNKADSQNRVIAKHLFKSTQVAEIWYPEEGETHEDYGFPTKFRLRQSVFSPWNGDKLFPYFDETGNMIAFSREFVILDEDNQEIKHFETYTAENYYLWKEADTNWVVVDRKDNILKRIPVVFAEQDAVEWYDVQRSISRLEVLISNHGDTNDYNGSPTVVTEGELEGMSRKGEQGKLIEVEKGGKVYYLSWDQAPESIKLEIENHFKIIHAYTQTPDISFESVKGISSISGIALRFLFMDAHLKVLDKREIFDPYLKRRLNILKGFVAVMNTGLKGPASKLKVDAKIVPYTIEDIVERMSALTIANGGKPLLSQKSSVTLAQLVSDKDEEWNQIQEEAEAENTRNAFEPTE